MIGHYLVTLTPEAEGRVLTNVMAPGHYLHPVHGSRCLVGTACDAARSRKVSIIHHPHFPDADYAGGVRDMIEDRYDSLCARFGAARVNAAIRDRISANQLRRTLAPAREGVAA